MIDVVKEAVLQVGAKLHTRHGYQVSQQLFFT